MGTLDELYKPSLALLTDLYELTMAYGYWKAGLHQREAVFHLLFRENPFRGGFTIACGLEPAVEYIERLRFDEADLAYLAEIRGGDGERIFEPAFLDFLGRMRFECDLDAVPEGNVVFPQEPLLRVAGPLVQAQVVETALLNILNFQTLIATKAARIVMAAQGEPVLEFGLRRAQGIDGGLSASRAAYIAGCAGTSNVLAGRLFGIPVAEAMPNNCVFLVDTYDTLQGVRNAVEVGRRLRRRGHEMVGIRLDSGDLAYLSIEARKILDAAGFPNAAIVASNDLDEHLITSLKDQGAAIGVWGVGTRLVTGYDQSALGGVYKISAIRDGDGTWHDKVKVSEQTIKSSTPGVLQVRRYRADGKAIGDVIFDQQHPIRGDCVMVDPADSTHRTTFRDGTDSADLLVPVFRRGKLVCDLPSLEEIRLRTQEELGRFHPRFERFLNPHLYPVGLEMGLYQRKTDAILKERGLNR